VTIRYGKWAEGLSEEEQGTLLALGVNGPFREIAPESNAGHEKTMRKFRKWADKYAELRYKVIHDRKTQGKYK